MKKSLTRDAARLSGRVNSRLNQYAIAGAAGIGLLALTQPAEAKIVYTKTHQYIEGKRGVLNIDLNHDGIVDFQLDINGASDGEWLAVYGYASGARVYESKSGLEAIAFPAGIRIGGNHAGRKPPKGGAFMEGVGCDTSCHSNGNWLDVRNKYLGLAFDINGKTHYGWARLSASISQKYGVRALLTGYAYETVPGKAIITGKTKGPNVATIRRGSLGELARGVR